MNILLEKIIIYGVLGIFLAVIVYIYIRKLRKESRIVSEKIEHAKSEGLFEPVSLHPVIDPNSCIRSGACVSACPEKNILGLRNGRATTINASRCIGHGACFHACPVEAISLHIGTEKRGVDLPHVNQSFETNVQGIYIAGEMGGMGLIKNAVEQGKQAVENIVKSLNKKINTDYDLIIVGAGPAGISASLTAKKHKLKFLTLEQDSLGGTVYTFPRSKIIMTAPMDLPLYGKVKLYETSKHELLTLWEEVLGKNEIIISENKKVDSIIEGQGAFFVGTIDGTKYSTKKILMAIGRRGSPRKLNIPGEISPKVAYRLLEPEMISDKHIIVAGGGDSAVEAAMLLAEQNEVTLSYRGDAFSRIKPRNKEKLEQFISDKKLKVILKSNLVSIQNESVYIKTLETDEDLNIPNDLVYIFAGGELPTEFLKKTGIHITRKFGEAILKHEK
ncbi:MAG: NAD(P)-binding domain-containing protein [Mariniphaga sp.]|nr:NAD(P)-binding domain-containing protein [Mariniphaga sp.]